MKLSNVPPFKIEYMGQYAYIYGDFRSGTHLSFSKDELLNFANNHNQIWVDLTKVSFMDSDSMNLIHDLEERAFIVWDESSCVFKRYMDKLNQKQGEKE